MALAKDLIADIRRFDDQLAANAKTMTALLDEHGTRLREIDGVGPVLAARLLGSSGSHRGSPRRAYTNCTGTAPVQIASADSSQHRLSRYGDRQLNPAIYTIAMVEIRCPPAPAARITRRRSPRAISSLRHPRAQTAPRRTPLAHHARR